jgi:hypothetical protein
MPAFPLAMSQIFRAGVPDCHSAALDRLSDELNRLDPLGPVPPMQGTPLGTA